MEVARALLSHPDLLLLDEAANGLDQSSRQAVIEHVRHVSHHNGTAVVWATHLIDEVELLDRVVFLAGGGIVGERTPHPRLEEGVH